MSNDRTVSEELRSLYAAIKENRDALDNCPGHRFDPVSLSLVPFSRSRAKCTVCGGEMDVLAADQYARGYEAAGGDPNDVIPGFKPECLCGEGSISPYCPRHGSYKPQD